jgi:dienelactone hydrolase
MTTVPYDPFFRGPAVVGVKTFVWTDAARNRRLPVEFYYPADPCHGRRDLDPAHQDQWLGPTANGRGETLRRQSALRDAPPTAEINPLIVFAHGWCGHRREFSSLCIHLASHGYWVVSADHLGSTVPDVIADLRRPDFDFESSWHRMANDRQKDIPLLISAAQLELGADVTETAAVGASMGGWTALMAPSVDRRVRTIVSLCPVGGEGPVSFHGVAALSRFLDFNWTTDVSAMIIVADRDTWLPLYGQLPLYARISCSSKRLIVLRRADHMHFVDEVEEGHEAFAQFTLSLDSVKGAAGPPWRGMAALMLAQSQLMPGNVARQIICGLTTLQVDAGLKRTSRAAELISHVEQELRRRNLDAYLLTPGRSGGSS